MELDVNELFFWEPIAFEGTWFEINRVVLLMFVASIACLAFFLAAARKRSLVPRGIQGLAESGYLFVRNNIAIDVIGPADGARFAPYLASIFFFIFFCNLLEIIPGINFPVTSRSAIPIALAIMSWIIFNFVGIKKHGLSYIKGVLFPPGVPWPVYFLLTPIEFFSTFIIRPVTLAIRLLANMMAGHVLLTIFFLFSADFVAFEISLPLGIVTAVVASALIVFELLVISIQAYIFTVLSAFYISEAIHGHGEVEHETSEHHEAPHETEGIQATAA